MLAELEHKLGYSFKNIQLLKNALNRNPVSKSSGIDTSDEILPAFDHLEFCGDRVLNLCITTILSNNHPEWSPGEFSLAYTHYTRNNNADAAHGGPLYRIAKELDLESYLILKAGEDLETIAKRALPDQKSKKYYHSRKKTKEGLLSNHMEAIMGAIFQDSDNDFNAVLEIVKKLFAPLGLLDPELVSISEYGASCVGSEVGIAESDMPYNQQFIKYIVEGRDDELIKANLIVDDETASLGFTIAITNQRVNVVPYLVAAYPISLEDIQTAIADDTVQPSIKNFLIRHLEKMYLNDLSLLNSLDPEDYKNLFIDCVKRGQINLLVKANFKIDPETAMQALKISIDNNQEEIIKFLLKNYSISPVAIKKLLHEVTTLPPAINIFLESHLASRYAADLSLLNKEEYESYFIDIASAGRHDELEKTVFSVKPETVITALEQAIDNGRTNVVPILVRNYAIAPSAIQRILSEKVTASPTTKGFLEKHLRKSPTVSTSIASSSMSHSAYVMRNEVDAADTDHKDDVPSAGAGLE